MWEGYKKLASWVIEENLYITKLSGEKLNVSMTAEVIKAST